MEQSTRSFNVVKTKEEVEISVHSLPEDNDVTNKATLHSPQMLIDLSLSTVFKDTTSETLAYFRAYQGSEN
ncbi:unnamed protein product [Rhizophagus irregularis]|uniref:Uncharacterized protein n=1 Tax=Rhizophagus irregularis TaxID=588596 RepID=A0A2N1NYF3_9GLOM|nr:hypothetical protein RhiirC2_769749 [Rhizophagus irregularis]CAB4393739.1 unnamed protein product [Rhizophagus irregularis]CAB5390272.1 unnamed protein product [Rhizophagus irregularis]